VSQLQYTVIGNDGNESIVVFVPGRAPMVADESHPNYEAILDGAREGDESIIDLFDVARSAAIRFDRLTDRVTVSNGQVYLDGDPVADALSAQIVRFLDEGLEDWQPLVKFMVKTAENPNEHSREQLYTWLARRDFTITAEGDVIGYKGVRADGEGRLWSIHSGQAIVDGEVVKGRIPNDLGSVIEMPRSEVQHDPAVGCHQGLHVGTFDYASGFGSTVLECHVNPRDVVSVPTDCDWAKVRTCRYTPVAIITEAYSVAVAPYDYEADDDEAWGDGEDF